MHFFYFDFFLRIWLNPNTVSPLPAMFYNDLVISPDAADLHCISLELEWDLILLRPCRSAFRKKKKKVQTWVPDLFFRWLKCAVLLRFPEQTTKLETCFSDVQLQSSARGLCFCPTFHPCAAEWTEKLMLGVNCSFNIDRGASWKWQPGNGESPDDLTDVMWVCR